jgi:hypothetical protein
MRKFSMLVCSLSLMGAALGCECLNHTAGVCDCQNDPRGCDRYSMHGPAYGTPAPVPAAIVAPVPAVVTPEVVKPIPR